MAVDAILKLRLRQVMKGSARSRDAALARAKAGDAVVAFQAHCEYGRTAEQPRIRTSMRVMAARTTFHSHRRVLEDKGSALVGMALHTGNVVAESAGNHAGRLRDAPSRGRGAVRVMAVRALDRALVDAVLEGKIEARADIGVALVANLFLAFGEQMTGLLRVVNRMAVDAADLGGRMRRAANVHLAEVLGVTAQAAVQHLTGFEEREADDFRCIAQAFEVLLAGTVAAFAAGAFRRLEARGNRFEMRVAVEAAGDIGMAGRADLAAEVVIFFRRALPAQQRRRQREQQEPARPGAVQPRCCAFSSKQLAAPSGSRTDLFLRPLPGYRKPGLGDRVAIEIGCKQIVESRRWRARRPGAGRESGRLRSALPGSLVSERAGLGPQ